MTEKNSIQVLKKSGDVSLFGGENHSFLTEIKELQRSYFFGFRKKIEFYIRKRTKINRNNTLVALYFIDCRKVNLKKRYDAKVVVNLINKNN